MNLFFFSSFRILICRFLFQCLHAVFISSVNFDFGLPRDQLFGIYEIITTMFLVDRRTRRQQLPVRRGQHHRFPSDQSRWCGGTGCASGLEKTRSECLERRRARQQAHGNDTLHQGRDFQRISSQSYDKLIISGTFGKLMKIVKKFFTIESQNS